MEGGSLADSARVRLKSPASHFAMVKEAWHGLGEALRWEREKLGAAGSALWCDASPVCRALTCWPSRLTQTPRVPGLAQWQLAGQGTLSGMACLHLGARRLRGWGRYV